MLLYNADKNLKATFVEKYQKEKQYSF